MLEPNVRTRFGGVAVVAAASALAFAHRGEGVVAGVALVALWAFTPAVYAFVGGQLAVVALYQPHALDWTVPVVELGVTLALLSPSVRTSSARRKSGIAAIVACCVGLAWVGLLELGTLTVAAVVVVAAGTASMLITRYGRAVTRGDVR
ncbi:hypothetical protein ZOD2009_14316 [Haladaptatus paucihalophilus DX253]|uniref:DUF8163 domain-containing protein n=1 Tax=Haladaptatus paucihalophilus DX253 TaxID=797209 RepID=E7QVM7_HALPU|nr:hypothetical protein [Haladaptatus paucihalophilus]EFW91290.1 hypothetical protein ZOD2009_14316 [Haladaptatus paucihalophilus DX253]SHL09787.1 hypothetical protein SAMN05444342_3014 [Haladaptatus paucihalophilus DX253]